MSEYIIDPELNDVLPDLSEEDYKALEQSLLTDGFKGAPIMVWGSIIVDGHNRYEICKKHDIPYEIKEVDFESKEDAIRWMVRQQIGRRTLTPLQRIKIVEKYRPFYKKKAEKNKSMNGGDKKSELQISSTPLSKDKKIDVRAELANDANVSTDTYSKGIKILKSGNDELINQTMDGEKSINKAYKELKMNNNGLAVSQDNNQGIDSSIKDDKVDRVLQNMNDTILIQLQERYKKYLSAFDDDIKWLLEKEFIRNDEEITGKVRSDLQNCYEKFKSIDYLLNNMQIDELEDNTIIVSK